MPFSTDTLARPAPFVPADTDLSGFGGFLLDVERLLSSELLAIGTPEECWAALMLWCSAWKQVPAGSLPNDERMLAHFSGAGRRRWPKVREVALHGFVLCSDGRLYHRFLCLDVMRARAKQEAYLAERKRVAEWRAKQKAVRVPNGDGTRTEPVPNASYNTSTIQDTSVKKEPNGSSFPELPIDPNGSISLTAEAARVRKRLIEKDFEAFWAVYPRKVAPKAARQKYEIARRSTSADEILDAARRYADSVVGKDPQFVAHPITWLNQGRWQDEDAATAPMHRLPDEPPPPLEDC